MDVFGHGVQLPPVLVIAVGILVAFAVSLVTTLARYPFLRRLIHDDPRAALDPRMPEDLMMPEIEYDRERIVKGEVVDHLNMIIVGSEEWGAPTADGAITPHSDKETYPSEIANIALAEVHASAVLLEKASPLPEPLQELQTTLLHIAHLIRQLLDMTLAQEVGIHAQKEVIRLLTEQAEKQKNETIEATLYVADANQLRETMHDELVRTSGDIEGTIRQELERSQRQSFWPNLLQNFFLNLLFFLLGVALTMFTAQGH